MLDNLKKAYTIPLSKTFQIVNPTYKYLKLTPATHIRNYDSGAIAKAIALTFRNNIIDLFNSIRKYIKKEDEKVFHKSPSKVSYYVFIEKNNVQFFFIVPQVHLGLIKEKIGDVWKGITISEVGTIPVLDSNSVYYQLNYKKEDALSLATDKRNNTLLESQLNSLDFMEQGDKLSITYNLIPCSQQSWKVRYKETMEKVKHRQPLEKEKLSEVYLLKKAFGVIYEVIDMFMDVVGELFGAKKKKKQDQTFLEVALGLSKTELSKATVKKVDKIIVNTQMVLGSESTDNDRKRNNAIGLCQSFNAIQEDNSIEYKQLKDYKHNILDYKYKSVGENKVSTDELQNFIALPGREILDQHESIEKTDVLETKVTEELQQGYIRLGDNIVKGNKTAAYMSTDKNLANLGLTVLGPQGAGKSEYFKNYAYDVVKAGESMVVIDFIKSCDLSNTIKGVVPEEKLLEIDLSKAEDLQGFGYNEIKIREGMSPFEVLENANLQMQQDMSLIDAISEGSPLTARMRRFLSAAAYVVHIHQGTSLRDVVNVLEDFQKRHEYISKVPNELQQYLEDEIRALGELDEYSKATKDNPAEVAGTKESKIEHILDRINLLREDFKLKFMFNKSLDNNVDFAEAMDHGKIILIKMPEFKFPLKYVKNVLVTYFTTKIWLASQIRGQLHEKPLRTHVLIDEVFQAPTCESVLLNILPQCRKFQLKFVFSAHYLSQIEIIREALKASGSSYMLLQGTDKKNFAELEEELHPFQLEDLLNLKRFNSLNLIKVNKGYTSFVTELPKPIK